MKEESKQKKKQCMRVFLIHSARSNEITLVTAAHMHGIAWHGQIWQTLKQNTLDVCTHAKEEALTHFHSVNKFLTFRLPGEQKHPLCSVCKVAFSVSSNNGFTPATLLQGCSKKQSKRLSLYDLICALRVLFLNFLT